MSYFKSFPVIVYPFTTFRNGPEFRAVKDIVLNVRIIKEIISGIQYYDYYDIIDDERIEVIAEKLYGDPNLHWVLMLINERFDYINDFPVSDDRLNEIIEEKYGVGSHNQTHMLFGVPHFEDEFGNVVDSGAPLSRAITNYEYEFRINESKRRIKTIDQRLIGQISRELEAAFSNG